MRNTLIIFLSAILVLSCATKKTEINSRIKTQTSVDNDIDSRSDQSILNIVNRVVNQVLTEQLDVEIEQITFDTDKPINPDTGNSPVKGKITTKLSKKSNTWTRDSAQIATDISLLSSIIDKSTIKAKVDNSEKTKTETGLNWWQRYLHLFGGIVLLLSIALYFFKK